MASVELCLEVSNANMKGKRKKGGGQNQMWPTSGPSGYTIPTESTAAQHIA